MEKRSTKVREHYRNVKGNLKRVKAHERKITSKRGEPEIKVGKVSEPETKVDKVSEPEIKVGKRDGCGGLLLVLMLFLVFAMISRIG